MASPRTFSSFEPTSNIKIINSRRFTKLYSVTDKILGGGSTCVVKKCIRLSDNKKFACKIIDKTVLSNVQLARVRQEITILELLKDNDLFLNIINYYESKIKIYIITEICTGGNLNDYIMNHWKNGKYTVREEVCRCVFQQIIKGVHKLHKNKIVHRDIKPENIVFINKTSYKIKIIDFGLSHIGTTNMVIKCGSPYYVAPEIIKCKEYTSKVDWWSCGILLYGILCGRYPFYSNNKSDRELYKMIVKGIYTFQNTNISLNGQHLISKLLVSDPNKRYGCNQILAHDWIKNKN